MQVTSWTYLENPKYADIDDMSKEQFEEATNAVIEEIKKRGYRICGYSHQDGYCPVIDDKYIFAVSYRTWGKIMQRAMGVPDDDNLGYVAWAWSAPEVPGENLPSETDYD